MSFETVDDTRRLAGLLTEALALADALNMPIVAIHVDQALSHLSDNPPADAMDLIATPVQDL